MEDTTPQPRSTAVRRGDCRTLQYYCLRTDWHWEVSGKTRSTTEAMQFAWGDELDIVTMLGIEPKPVKRDWRRFNESRELVDAGRSLKVAGTICGALRAESAREQGIRREANHGLIADLIKTFEESIEFADTRRAALSKAIAAPADPSNLASRYESLIGSYQQATYSRTLLIAAKREQEGKVGALLKAMLLQQEGIRESLVGRDRISIADIDDATTLVKWKAEQAWLRVLEKGDHIDDYCGFIARYRTWEGANDTLKKRKMNDVAEKLKKLTNFGHLG